MDAVERLRMERNLSSFSYQRVPNDLYESMLDVIEAAEGVANQIWYRIQEDNESAHARHLREKLAAFERATEA